MCAVWGNERSLRAYGARDDVPQARMKDRFALTALAMTVGFVGLRPPCDDGLRGLQDSTSAMSRSVTLGRRNSP